MRTQLLQLLRRFLSSSSQVSSRQKEPLRLPNSFQQGWKTWLWLTGPGGQYFGKNIEEQERLRRSRLLSSLIPLILIAICIFIPLAFSRPGDWIPIIAIALFGVAIAFLNRIGKVTMAGLLYTLAIDISLTISALTQPHGIANSNIPDLDIFALSILMVGLILKRSFIPIVALLQLITGFILFNIIPHDPLLTQEIQVNLHGHAYAYLEDFFLLEVCGAILAWLSSKSFSKALERADRAEELDQLVQQQLLLLDEVNRLYQEKALASETDAITNLLNHRAIMSRFSEQIALCQVNKGSSCAFLFVDLDHFKHINDSWGHRAGDAVLRETGQRLQMVLRENAVVGRYGGEEFAIVLNDIDLLGASGVAERIKAAITGQPYLWQTEDTQEEIRLSVTASIGIAVYGLHSITAEMLLEYADRAMYSAKEQGRNRICIADVERIDEHEKPKLVADAGKTVYINPLVTRP
jgi:diguanylate cyclase (GGDEF)-like protein